MTDNHDIQDRVDRYLLNRMSEAERAEFEQQMRDDKELREQVNFTRIVKTELADRARLEEMMQRCDDRRRRQYTLRRRKIVWWTTSLSAAAVVALGVFFSWNGNDRVVPNVSTAGSEISFRGSNAPADVATLINSGKYEEALATVDSLKTVLDKYNAEIAADTCIADDERQYRLTESTKEADRLDWLRANALIGLGKTDEAAAILLRLRSGQSEYSLQADSLYNLIK